MPAPARIIALPQPTSRARPSADWPLARYVQWWLDNATAGLAPESRRVYRYVTDAMIQDSGDIALADLTPADLQCTIGRMQAAGKSDATVALAKAGISSALGSAVRLGILGANPAGAGRPYPLARRRVNSKLLPWAVWPGVLRGVRPDARGALMALHLHPMVLFIVAFVVIVVALAMVDAVCDRRRRHGWRPGPPSETTNDPTTVWLAQAEAQHRRNRP